MGEDALKLVDDVTDVGDRTPTFKIRGRTWTVRATPLPLRVKVGGEWIDAGHVVDWVDREILYSTAQGIESSAIALARAVAYVARKSRGDRLKTN